MKPFSYLIIDKWGLRVIWETRVEEKTGKEYITGERPSGKMKGLNWSHKVKVNPNYFFKVQIRSNSCVSPTVILNVSESKCPSPPLFSDQVFQVHAGHRKKWEDNPFVLLQVKFGHRGNPANNSPQFFRYMVDAGGIWKINFL